MQSNNHKSSSFTLRVKVLVTVFFLLLKMGNAFLVCAIFPLGTVHQITDGLRYYS